MFVPGEEGIMVAGIPVGSDEFAKQDADDVADKTVRAIDSLLELTVSAQNFFLLLRKSLQLRTAHLPHCGGMQQEPNKVKDATCDILDIDIGVEAWEFRSTLLNPQVALHTRQQLHSQIVHYRKVTQPLCPSLDPMVGFCRTLKRPCRPSMATSPHYHLTQW